MSAEHHKSQNLDEWRATQSRLLKAGVRSNDPETVQTVIDNVSARLDPGTGERFFALTVSRMMDEESFSFVPDRSQET